MLPNNTTPPLAPYPSSKTSDSELCRGLLQVVDEGGQPLEGGAHFGEGGGAGDPRQSPLHLDLVQGVLD